jgi:hypothetical protein
MRGVDRVLTAAAIVGICATTLATSVLAQSRVPETQSVRLFRGSIAGTVSDERGGALAGATVSAIGATWATAVSDVRGQFSIDALPPGDYVVQAHLSGFAGSRRETVHVGAGRIPTSQRLTLRRLEAPVATSGSAPPVYARPIIAAGIELPTVTLSDKPEAKNGSTDAHSHTETAWRLRHIRRSILKDSNTFITVVERDTDIKGDSIFGGSIFGRAVDSAASMAATFFTELPFSGEVNVLTTSAFAPGNLFSGELLPRGVAYLAIGAPTPAGDWSFRAAMSQGDLASWIVSGAFASDDDGTHQYDFGYTYSTQEYLGGNPAALAGVKDGSRNVGEVFAFDRWTLSPRVAVEYGARFARHDYLTHRGLFSPKVGLIVEPVKDTRVSASVAQRMVAPGAEEFLATEMPGPWLPPERTFAPLGGLGDSGFDVERARYVDLSVEREFSDAYVLGIRRFFQDVQNQLVTLFGVSGVEGPRSVGHYFVASAGSVDADGWAFRLASPPSKRIRGSIDYSVTRARWLARSDDDIAPFAPAAVRPEQEDIHDVTTSFETDIPETATRVYVLYKINSAYTRSNTDLTRPGLDARFDVQVNQALPFALGGTRWEVLLGVRNLFRDPHQPGSVYDELLVVKPPKRVVGGFLVRF